MSTTPHGPTGQQYPAPQYGGQQYPQHPQPQYGAPPYQPYPPYMAPAPVKSHAAAILLSFFFGILGVDRFYLGHIGMGFAKLLVGWMTFGVWPLIDFILIILKGTQGLKQIHWT